jgi:hypothetical protein
MLAAGCLISSSSSGGGSFVGSAASRAQQHYQDEQQCDKYSRKLFHLSASFIWLRPIVFDDIYAEGEKVLQGFEASTKKLSTIRE